MKLSKLLVAFALLLVPAVGLAAGAKPSPAPTPVAATPTPTPKATPKPTHVKVTADPNRTIYIKGEINEKSADSFITDINNLDDADQTKPIYIIITSPGGSLEDGFRMENNMDSLHAPTVCIVDSYADSMASGIFLHCTERYMRPHSQLLFHWGSVSISGPRLEAQKQMELSLKLFDQFDQDNANHLGLTLKEYRAKIDHDWWLTEEDALKAHAADAIVDNFKLPKQVPDLKPLPNDDFFKIFGP